MVDKSSRGMLRAAEKSWQQQAAANDAAQNATIDSAKSFVQSVVAAAAAVHKQGSDMLEEGNRTSTRVTNDIHDTKQALNTALEDASRGLLTEQQQLTEQRAYFQHDVESSVRTVANRTQGLVADVTGTADQGEAAVGERARKHAKFEERMALLPTEGHPEERVRALTDETKALDADNAGLQHWAAGFSGQTAAYESTVSAKLRELGGEVPKPSNRTLPGFPPFVDTHVADRDADLAKVLTDSDSKIAAILKDERLSEEEQEKAIAAVRHEASQEAERIHAAQLETAQKQAAVDAAVDRFENLAAAAEAAAERAEADMTPGALAVRQQLRNLTDTLTHLQRAPWLQSVLQISDQPPTPERGGLEHSNRELAHANADLRAQIAKAEGVLAAHERAYA